MRGFHSRGYLPHFDVTGLYQHVCFHLSDSIPQRLKDCLERDLKLMPAKKQGVARSKRLSGWMDYGHGCCPLKVKSVGDEVERILLSGQSSRYYLRAWVIMPNHIHCVIRTLEGHDLPQIIGEWKMKSAVLINEYLKSVGKPPLQPVWYREYFDRYIRNEKHLRAAIDYVHRNPVKAGLTFRSENWRWSSAKLEKERNIEWTDD